MWFIFVAVGLLLLTVCGIYVRRRLGQALGALGLGPRGVRVMRWIVGWLLWGYPVLLIGSIIVSRLLGSPTIPRFDSFVPSVLLALPFILAVLVVLQSVPWLLALEVAHAVVRRRRGVPAAARLRTLGVVTVVGAFALYTPLRVLVERGDVRMRRHSLSVAQPTTPPLRIAFLADVQQDVHTDADRARELYAAIVAQRPDLVLSGGDWINTGPDYIGIAGEAAAALKAPLGVFSVRGDHEHFAYIDRDRSAGEVERSLAAHGVTMLANEVRWFEHHGKRIGVLFLNYNYIVRTEPAAVAGLLAKLDGADYSIVVTHQLDRALADVLEDKVDLVLGAHTHGGQVNPVVGLTHVNLARLETRFVDGRYTLGDRTTVIVTAGIGMSVVPIRYAAPGSIELLELRL